MALGQSLDELNWDVLVALGWKIEPVEKFHGRQLYSIFDPTGRVRGTDEGDPYSVAKRQGSIPLYAMSETMALKLLEDYEYTINRRYYTNSQGVRTLLYYVSLLNEKVFFSQDLAYAVCKCFLDIKQKESSNAVLP